MQIAHLTTVHPRVDARIRIKEVGSLAEAFEEPVALFVMDGKGDAIDADGKIRIIDIGQPPKKRLMRMIVGVWRMWHAVLANRPQVVHFHDPELIPLGLLLKCCGFGVIYDVHEDVPRDVLTKFWLPAMMRRPISLLMTGVEWLAGWCFTAIISATPDISVRFPSKKTTLVQNYPILNELINQEVSDYLCRPPHFAYIGGIGKTRGIHEMVDALGRTDRHDVRLQLAGEFRPASLKIKIESMPGWQQVDYSNWVNREQVSIILNNVRAGLVVYLPTPAILNAYPTKMFEYMSVGLPVIASDFPVWRGIVDKAGCGLLVDPLNPSMIADAMLWILNNPDEAKAMGKRGRKAVEESYNWEREGSKLIGIYNRLLSD